MALKFFRLFFFLVLLIIPGGLPVSIAMGIVSLPKDFELRENLGTAICILFLILSACMFAFVISTCRGTL